MSIHKLLNKYPLISDQVSVAEVGVVLSEIEAIHTKGIKGDIVEFGCYVGTTSLFISRLLKELVSEKRFHVYDSFSGLPPKDKQDISPAGEQFKAGELYATKSQLVINYKKAGLKLPYIHKGWFNDLSDKDIPAVISFAFLDGDFYHSIQAPLQLINDKLRPGAVIVIDDYLREALPGAQAATDKWLSNRPDARLYCKESMAIITIQG